MLIFVQAWNVCKTLLKIFLNKNEENQNAQNKIYKKMDGLYLC